MHCRQQNKYDLKTEILFGNVRKRCGKRRKCWSPAFSPFPTMFSKGLFSKVVISGDCMVQCKGGRFWRSNPNPQVPGNLTFT